MTSVRKTLKTLVWWAQNRSISSGICPENNHKIRRFFYRLLSGQVCHENSREIPAKSADFSAILSLKIPRNFTFFPRPIRSPALRMPLIGESLDFGFYFFKQQFKASPGQFYIFLIMLLKDNMNRLWLILLFAFVNICCCKNFVFVTSYTGTFRLDVFQGNYSVFYQVNVFFSLQLKK